MSRPAETYVYWLRDPRPRPPHVVFYVGISLDPEDRLRCHRRDPNSSAWKRIQEIEADGYECRIEILNVYSNREDAVELEGRLIAQIPWLCNKQRLKRWSQ